MHSALWHAEKAYKTGSMISKSFTMEIMLFLAGVRQIKKAIELIGIQENTNKIIGVLLTNIDSSLSDSYWNLKENLKFQSDQTVIDNFPEKRNSVVKYLTDEGYKNIYQSSDENIEKIFFQKVALLSLET